MGKAISYVLVYSIDKIQPHLPRHDPNTLVHQAGKYLGFVHLFKPTLALLCKQMTHFQSATIAFLVPKIFSISKYCRGTSARYLWAVKSALLSSYSASER